MNTVPILKSLIDPQHLASIIGENYGFSDVRCQLIKATMRDVYHVWTEQGEYVALIYSYQASLFPFRVSDEVKFLKSLNDYDNSFVSPILDIHYGEMTTLLYPEGERHLVLYPYIHGKTFNRQPKDEDAFLYGETIAKIHTLSDIAGISSGHNRWNQLTLLDEAVAIIKKELHYRPEVITFVESVLGKLRIGLNELSTEQPAFGMIHGDVIPSNAIIGDDGQLYVVDFELCGRRWRMYDVATFLNELGFWGAATNVEQSFLAGYESMRTIPDDERASIPILGAARTIWELGNAAKHVNTRGNHVYLSDRVVDSMIRNLKQNLNKIGSKT